MEPHHRDARGGWSRLLTRVAQVVPDLATFAVDDGFSYRVPEGLEDLQVGAVVRVPLGGRRVRGFVVDVRDLPEGADTSRLKDVAGRSGTVPVFDVRMLQTLRWAALHYVGPLATVLGRTTPPNVPRAPKKAPLPPVEVAAPSPLPEVTAAALAGRHLRPTAWIGSGPWADGIAAVIAPVLAEGASAVVVLPTAVEAEAVAADLAEALPGRIVLGGSSLPAKEATAQWGRAATTGGVVVVGTREVALWRIERLAVAIVVEEGRRAMKSPQSPTLHVREVLRRRAAVERFPLVTAGAVPTTEIVGAGAHLMPPAHRAWRLVEVVDRREDLDQGGIVTDRVRHAVRSVVNRGGRVFALVHRRGYAPAFRCVACGEIRRCVECGSAVERDGSCRRCHAVAGACPHCRATRFAPLGAGVGRVVDELRRSVGDQVGPAGAGRLVAVGTERDLVGLEPVDLAVLIDVDTWLLAPNYRAEEEALRVIARLAGRVAAGSGRRAMVQTAQPAHRVLDAARRGDATELLVEIVDERAQQAFPPAGELIAIDLADAPESADGALRDIVGADAAVLGPGNAGTGLRWLVQGTGLHPVRVRLRRQVQQWRDSGTRVRVDADPIDL